jgi:hypothetical protein
MRNEPIPFGVLFPRSRGRPWESVAQVEWVNVRTHLQRDSVQSRMEVFLLQDLCLKRLKISA